MRSLMLIATLVLGSTLYAEETNPKLEAYKQRLAERRAVALELRRDYNAAKGPHVYRTAIAYNFPRYIAIENGWVNQPPIPVRPILVVSPSTTVYNSGRTLRYHANPARNVFVRN